MILWHNANGQNQLLTVDLDLPLFGHTRPMPGTTIGFFRNRICVVDTTRLASFDLDVPGDEERRLSLSELAPPKAANTTYRLNAALDGR